MISLDGAGSQSVFEVQLFKDFDKHLVRNAITFSGRRLKRLLFKLWVIKSTKG
jgi:hypothetical protein